MCDPFEVPCSTQSHVKITAVPWCVGDLEFVRCELVGEKNRFLASLTTTSDALLCTQAIGKNRNKGERL